VLLQAVLVQPNIAVVTEQSQRAAVHPLVVLVEAPRLVIAGTVVPARHHLLILVGREAADLVKERLALTAA
jgi:hypothetical protein